MKWNPRVALLLFAIGILALPLLLTYFYLTGPMFLAMTRAFGWSKEAQDFWQDCGPFAMLMITSALVGGYIGQKYCE